MRPSRSINDPSSKIGLKRCSQFGKGSISFVEDNLTNLIYHILRIYGSEWEFFVDTSRPNLNDFWEDFKETDPTIIKIIEADADILQHFDIDEANSRLHALQLANNLQNKLTPFQLKCKEYYINLANSHAYPDIVFAKIESVKEVVEAGPMTERALRNLRRNQMKNEASTSIDALPTQTNIIHPATTQTTISNLPSNQPRRIKNYIVPKVRIRKEWNLALDMFLAAAMTISKYVTGCEPSNYSHIAKQFFSEMALTRFRSENPILNYLDDYWTRKSDRGIIFKRCIYLKGKWTPSDGPSTWYEHLVFVQHPEFIFPKSIKDELDKILPKIELNTVPTDTTKQAHQIEVLNDQIDNMKKKLKRYLNY